MEEVWKNINLSSLPENSSSSSTTTTTTTTATATATATATDQPFPSAILQDFLSIPLLSNTPSKSIDSSSFIPDISLSHHPKQPLPLPLSSFSLNSELPDFGFQFLETRAPVCSNPANQHSGSSSLNTSPVQLKKKAPKKSLESPEKRFVRLMKNRDSADRARARKEVYTKELEIRLAHLKKENALLRKQIKSSKKKEPAAHQCPKKDTSLYRTLTAPF
ncbi:protein FD-like [Humulus lupulus]|uniref:protein FD-like n=1 Tax=Humulus lupulus TaxID=3486 RepID=UPI002B41489D|nr:protein FD-like [Humulus lupulus]